MSDARTTTRTGRRTALVSKLAATGLGLGSTVVGTVVVAHVDQREHPISGVLALDGPPVAPTPVPLPAVMPEQPVPDAVPHTGPHATSRGTS